MSAYGIECLSISDGFNTTPKHAIDIIQEIHHGIQFNLDYFSRDFSMLVIILFEDEVIGNKTVTHFKIFGTKNFKLILF